MNEAIACSFSRAAIGWASISSIASSISSQRSRKSVSSTSSLDWK